MEEIDPSVTFSARHQELSELVTEASEEYRSTGLDYHEYRLRLFQHELKELLLERPVKSQLETTEPDPGQFALALNVRPDRTVHWINGIQNTKRSRLGRVKTVTSIIMERETYAPSTTVIDAEQISKLEDENLRYALRFADAASAIGFLSDGPHSSHAHDVGVTATDEGFSSRLISASYTGVVRDGIDTFLQNLHDAAPDTDS